MVVPVHERLVLNSGLAKRLASGLRVLPSNTTVGELGEAMNISANPLIVDRLMPFRNYCEGSFSSREKSQVMRCFNAVARSLNAQNGNGHDKSDDGWEDLPVKRIQRAFDANEVTKTGKGDVGRATLEFFSQVFAYNSEEVTMVPNRFPECTRCEIATCEAAAVSSEQIDSELAKYGLKNSRLAVVCLDDLDNHQLLNPSLNVAMHIQLRAETKDDQMAVVGLTKAREVSCPGKRQRNHVLMPLPKAA